MDNKQLADLLYPNAQPVSYWLAKYPVRDLPNGAEVTRLAPSPTGFLHIGGVYTALINASIARQTNGVCMLRIEDTDQKRLVDDALQCILDGFDTFRVGFTEGKLSLDGEVGNYGPYVQSQRKAIYESFAKEMVLRGMAYPCFCTADDLSKMRADQEAKKHNPGYYGEYAKCRNLTFDQIQANILAHKSWVLRFKCPYKEGDKMDTIDLVRGKRYIPCNYNDVVIMKSDGIPPYNLAHVVDDTLMHTTLVLRSDEWLPSLTEHLQLFEALGLTPPKYAHISPIQKIDPETNERRKISKRKEPEANVLYFVSKGYPVASVFDYLMAIANSDFEAWRSQNPKGPIDNFHFNIAKLNISGALFDIIKLNDVSKNAISNMTAGDVYTQAHTWAQKYDTSLCAIMERDPEYYTKILNIDRDIPKPRKDIACWSELAQTYSYMFDDLFDSEKVVFPDKYSTKDILSVLDKYPQYYNTQDDQTQWFDRIKDLAQEIGFAREVKEYKKAPEQFSGHCGDVSTIIRVALTGRTMTPNLYDICKLLGKERIATRLNKAKNIIKNS